MKKLKVVCLCHFSNKDVRFHLPLYKGGSLFLMLLHSLFPRRYKAYKYEDFAPWINSYITEFEKIEDIEFHIVAPHFGLKKLSYEYEEEGIYYHFFSSNFHVLTVRLKEIIFKVTKSKYWLNRWMIQKFINKIKPDIVNLIGTENPYYSLAALDIRHIPVISSAQTVYSNPARLKLSGEYSKHRSDVELRLFEKIKYYGCAGRIHRDLIVQYKPEAIVFKIDFPIQYPSSDLIDVPKVFDFAFFAQEVTNKKGAEDALKALALVKKVKPDVKLTMVGKCTASYKSYLVEKIISLKLEGNVIFHDYFPVHAEMHQYIKQAKYALLPIKLDVISSTIIESMLLGLPLVTYKTTGTPMLNRNYDCVLISDIGDIQGLADNMIQLLNSEELAERLKNNALKSLEENNNEVKVKQLIADYRAVINHYNHEIPIPENLLFNIDEYPIYQ